MPNPLKTPSSLDEKAVTPKSEREEENERETGDTVVSGDTLATASSNQTGISSSAAPLFIEALHKEASRRKNLFKKHESSSSDPLAGGNLGAKVLKFLSSSGSSHSTPKKRRSDGILGRLQSVLQMDKDLNGGTKT